MKKKFLLNKIKNYLLNEEAKTVSKCPGYDCTEEQEGYVCPQGSEGANNSSFICKNKKWVPLAEAEISKRPPPPAEAAASKRSAPPAEAAASKRSAPPAEAVASKRSKSSYKEYSGEFPIPYGTSSNTIRKIQEHLAQNPAFEKVLSIGTLQKKYDYVTPVDGKYGPRTELAFQIAISLVSKNSKEKEEKDKFLTQNDYAFLMQQSPKDWTFSAREIGVELEDAKEEASPSERKDESISYKKDLLNPTKNRYKELEKLMFERLVKNANRL